MIELIPDAEASQAVLSDKLGKNDILVKMLYNTRCSVSENLYLLTAVEQNRVGE